MNKPLCPILLIGFNPPEEGQRDLRRCTNECALYDEIEEQCSIKTCAQYLEIILESAQGYFPEEDYPDEENYEFNATEQSK